MVICEDKLLGVISIVLIVFTAASTVCVAIGAAGASVTKSVLVDLHWITATSEGNPLLQKGDAYGGLNAIYIQGVDDDVVKYVDCADDADLCDVCSKISSGMTIMLAFSVITGLISTICCLLTVCKPRWSLTAVVMALISLVLAASSLGSFDKCFNAYKDQDGFTDVSYHGGASAVIASISMMAAVCVLGMVLTYMESRRGEAPTMFPED
jgi:hypothetical protein